MCFSHGKVTHYNKTTSKNFFPWVGHPWQFDHFKSSEFSKEKPSTFYSECAFLALKRIHHFSIWWVHHLILLFLLYNAYYLKSLTRLSIVSLVKRGATVITQFWVIPQNSLFFKIKIKNNNKGWQCGESRSGNQATIFGGNSRPNCTPLCPKMEKKCKFKVKLNDYWTNLHKN